MNFNKFRPVSDYLIILLLTAGLMIINGCAGKTDDSVISLKVKKGVFEILIPAFGELQAVKSTPIAVPAQVRGSQTISWMAPENSMVKKGDIVVRFDSDWYYDRIRTQEFEIAKLNLDIRKKENELGKEKNELQGQLGITEIEKDIASLYAARDESLYSRNKIIEDQINLEYLKTKTRHYNKKKDQMEEKSRAELQLLQSKRHTHQMQVDQYKEDLKSLEITAPHEGLFVYEKNWRGEKPRVGQQVWRGTKLGKLPDLSQMEVKLYVLESEAAGLKKGLNVTVILDSSPGTTFSGKIITIDTIAKPLERDSPLKFFEVKASLDKTDQELMKPGGQVKATIFVKQQQDVLAVPNQALTYAKDGVSVLVKTSSGFDKRRVETGDSSLTQTVIEKGLEAGETILLGNPNRKNNR